MRHINGFQMNVSRLTSPKLFIHALVQASQIFARYTGYKWRVSVKTLCRWVAALIAWQLTLQLVRLINGQTLARCSGVPDYVRLYNFFWFFDSFDFLAYLVQTTSRGVANFFSMKLILRRTGPFSKWFALPSEIFNRYFWHHRATHKVSVNARRGPFENG